MAYDYLLVAQLEDDAHRHAQEYRCPFVEALRKRVPSGRDGRADGAVAVAFDILNRPWQSFGIARGQVHLQQSSPRAWLAVDNWRGEFEAR